MAKNYVFGIKTVKYGTPTGLATMPVAPTALPDTVKGSVSIDESEGAEQKFFVDQQSTPVKVITTEMGELNATMNFYDLDYATIGAFKGGTVDAVAPKGWKPAIGFVQIEKSLEITLDSGHILNLFNAHCKARIMGGGGRDKMFQLELKITPQMTADGLGSWEITDPA